MLIKGAIPVLLMAELFLLGESKYFCSEGWEICSHTGNCVPKECQQVDSTDSIYKCGPGQQFCTSVNACVSACPTTAAKQVQTSCSGELEFCFSQGKCSPATECKDDNGKICDEGAVFCPSSGFCQVDTCFSLKGETSCPVGHIFCAALNKCEPSDVCASPRSSNANILCPNEYVYCLGTRECEPLADGCGGRGTTIACPPNMAFCMSQGKCSSECTEGIQRWQPNAKCPKVYGEYNFTSCFTSNDCVDSVCCNDLLTYHSQCTTSDGSDAARSVAALCSMLEGTTSQGAVEERSCDDDNPCLPKFVCCAGTCKSNPLPEKSCQIGSLYCEATKTCVEIGSPCGEICPLGEVYCLISESCTAKSDCELDSYFTVPILLPGPLIVYVERVSEEFDLQTIFTSSANTVTDKSMIVSNQVYSIGGVFELKNGDSWRPIMPSEVLPLDSIIRFSAIKVNSFYYSSLKMFEKESGIERVLVQLLAPPPENLFEQESVHVRSAEDELLMISLSEVITLKKENNDGEQNKDITVLWSANSNGLLDTGHSATKIWVDLILRGNIPRLRRISLEYEPGPSLDHNDMLPFEISDGEKWIQLPATKAALIYLQDKSEFDKILLRAYPKPNMYGTVYLLFKPIYEKDVSPGDYSAQIIRMNFQILPLNDSPTRKQLTASKQVPSLINCCNNIPMVVGTLVSYFYADVEHDAMGISIVYAQKSDIGYWAYSVDDGHSVVEIVGLDKNVFTEYLSSHGVHQGVVETRTSEEAMKSVTTEALFLPESAILQYNLKDATADLPKGDSLMKTALIAFAWDGLGDVDRSGVAVIKNISVPECANCGPYGKLSKEPFHTYAEKKNCDGTAVIKDEKVIDACNVCVGDGTSCLDCNNDAFGSATIDACTGECVGGKTGKTALVRDCIGECGKNTKVVASAGEAICLPSDATDLSGINCGDETTPKILDSCGKCVPLEEAKNPPVSQCCEETCAAPTVSDKCGSCDLIADAATSGCAAMDLYGTKVLDSAYETVDNKETATDGVLTDERRRLTSFYGCMTGIFGECSIVNTESQEKLPVRYYGTDGNVIFTPTVLKSGRWDLSCARTKESTDEIKQEHEILIYDSHDLKLELYPPTNMVAGEEIHVNVKVPEFVSLPQFWKYLTCVISQEGAFFDSSLNHLASDDSNYCTLPSTLKPVKAKIGILINRNLMTFVESKKLVLSMKEIDIQAKAPSLAAAIFYPSSNLLQVLFDTQIEMADGNCDSHFNPTSSVGIGSKCEVKDDLLTVFAPNKDPNGKILEMSNSNKIYQSGAPKISNNAAKGSITIETVEEKENSLSIYLTAPGCTCNGTMVNAFVSYAKNTLQPEIQASWNVSWDAVSQNQQQHLLVWDSLGSIDSAIRSSVSPNEISFPADLMLSGVQYIIAVHLETADGVRITDQVMTKVKNMPIAEGYVLQIMGPLRIRAHREAIYKAEVKLCGDETEILNAIEFHWDIEGVAMNRVKVVENMLIIPQNVLSAGKQYKVYVNAVNIVASMSAETETTIDVKSLGVEATLSVNSMVVGSFSAFVVDASLSRDLDNKPGDLAFRCSCSRGTEPCITTTRKRFENVIPSEDLESAWFSVPPHILAPNTYTMTCKVSKGLQSDSKSVTIVILPGNAPQIIVYGQSQAVLAEDRVVIQALVTTSGSATMWWRSTPHLAALKTTSTFPEKFDERPYNLVLPPLTLSPNTNYKLQLMARHEGETNIASADVIVSTLSVPSGGTLSVSPTEGSAFKTKFIFESNNWQVDLEDAPIKTHFGYKSSDSPTVWLMSSTKIDPKVLVTLPASELASKLTSRVKVCTVSDACTTINGPELTVQKSPIGLSDAMESIKRIDELDSVFTHLQNIGMSMTMPDDAKIFSSVAAFAQDRLQSYIQGTIDGVDNGNVADVIEAGLRVYRAMAASTNATRTFNKILSDLVRLAKIRYGKATGLASARLSAIVPVSIQIPNSRQDRIYFPEGDSQEQRKSRIRRGTKDNQNTRSPRLQPLKHSDVTEPDADKPLTTKEIEAFIKVKEELLLSYTTDSFMMKAALTDLADSITEYLPSLCLDLQFSSEPVTINTELIAIIVLMYSDVVQQTTSYPVAMVTPGSFVNVTNRLKWNPGLSQYNEWNCMKGSKCYGVCLATVEYNSIFESPTTASQPGVLKSHMVQTSLINPKLGAVIKPDSIVHPLAIDYTLNIIGNAYHTDIKCARWNEDGWMESFCQKNSLRNITDDTVEITCQCMEPGYVVAYLKADSSKMALETTSDGDTPKTVFKKKRIEFKLDSDYDEVVGDKSVEFAIFLKPQIADHIDVPISSIVDVTVKPGTISVAFTLVQNDAQRISSAGSTLEEITAKLYEEMGEGLYFKGLNNEQLKAIPPTTVYVKRMDVAVLIGVILGVAALVVLILVGVACYIRKKNKNKNDKVHHFQNDSKIPTYTGISFAQSLDGAPLSFKKKNSQSLDDNVFRQRMISPESIDSGISSPVWSSDRDVPPPSKYKPPSRKQLENSAPIPDHIMKKIREEIPGTPEY